MGNGPGAFDQYEALVRPATRGCTAASSGSGATTASAPRTPDGTPYYAYGGDFGEVVHDGNFVMDGMLLSNDVPTPSLHEYKAVVQPVRFAFDGEEGRGHATCGTRPTRPTCASAGASSTTGSPVASGDLEVPVVAAGESRARALPTDRGRSPDAETWLTIDATLAAPTPLGT